MIVINTNDKRVCINSIRSRQITERIKYRVEFDEPYNNCVLYLEGSVQVRCQIERASMSLMTVRIFFFSISRQVFLLIDSSSVTSKNHWFPKIRIHELYIDIFTRIIIEFVTGKSHLKFSTQTITQMNLNITIIQACKSTSIILCVVIVIKVSFTYYGCIMFLTIPFLAKFIKH